MPGPTVYLSRLIGVVALIVAAAMLADKSTVVSTVEHLGQDRTSLLLLGFVRVVAGELRQINKKRSDCEPSLTASNRLDCRVQKIPDLLHK